MQAVALPQLPQVSMQTQTLSSSSGSPQQPPTKNQRVAADAAMVSIESSSSDGARLQADLENIIDSEVSAISQMLPEDLPCVPHSPTPPAPQPLQAPARRANPASLTTSNSSGRRTSANLTTNSNELHPVWTDSSKRPHSGSIDSRGCKACCFR